MEGHFKPLPFTHLLQHTLRSLCISENTPWAYAVFWRILPRNYPPPNWDFQGHHDKSRKNWRNWILLWEDGFCNFTATTGKIHFGAASFVCRNSESQQLDGLQPELFFKMSHEIYNYGEGLIGKVAADQSHKWVYKENCYQYINLLRAWHYSGDSHPRTWGAQFQSGIKTIALIAVNEGVLQLGAVKKVTQDLGYIVQVQKKFNYLLSIPGFLLPHPSSSSTSSSSSSATPYKINLCSDCGALSSWFAATCPPLTPVNFYDHFRCNPVLTTPLMSSLDALPLKLPSVAPAPSPLPFGYCESPPWILPSQMPPEPMEIKMVAEEMDEGEALGC